MTLIKFKHIDRFVDRHGKVRYYYRAGRGKRLALPGAPGTPDFMAAYDQAASGGRIERVTPQRGAPGTFDRLIQDYFTSPEFLRLAGSTQRAYRPVIERLVRVENIGHRLVAEMQREHVKRIVSKRAATPAAANNALKKLKILIHFAIDNGWRTDDPTLRIKKFDEGEFHTWTDEEIATFERLWPVGSTARLAFDLLLYTGQRRSDIVRMEWNDVEERAIRVVQQKTGAKLSVAIHPELERTLAACDGATGSILRTSFGKPFTSNGFGNFMADRIGEAGLPERCVTHGLRKAAARRLAEAGCSANEIAAITGHATLAEVTRYTKAAEQKRLARTAIDRLSQGSLETNLPNRTQRLGNVEKKDSDFNPLSANWRPRQESNLRPSA